MISISPDGVDFCPLKLDSSLFKPVNTALLTCFEYDWVDNEVIEALSQTQKRCARGRWVICSRDAPFTPFNGKKVDEIRSWIKLTNMANLHASPKSKRFKVK